MKRTAHLILYMAIAAIMGCTGSGGGSSDSPTADTVYTQQATMNIHGYQPVRALQIIDSALIARAIAERLIQHDFFVTLRGKTKRAPIVSWCPKDTKEDNILYTSTI